MNAIQGSASSAGAQESPSSSEQPSGGIPYGSYGGSTAGSYGSYGAYGSPNFGDPNGPGGAGGGGHWAGGNGGGGSNWGGGGGSHPPEPGRRKHRVRRGMAFGAAGLAVAAAVAVGSYDAV